MGGLTLTPGVGEVSLPLPSGLTEPLGGSGVAGQADTLDFLTWGAVRPVGVIESLGGAVRGTGSGDCGGPAGGQALTSDGFHPKGTIAGGSGKSIGSWPSSTQIGLGKTNIH